MYLALILFNILFRLAVGIIGIVLVFYLSAAVGYGIYWLVTQQPVYTILGITVVFIILGKIFGWFSLLLEKLSWDNNRHSS